jgi:protoporphyrinogen oxidase
MNRAPILILGAGPTGLSAAFHVGPDALLVERESRVGGACRSVYVNGFTFDLAGHVMFSNDPYVHELYTLLLRDNVHWQEGEALILGRPSRARFGYPLHGGFQALMDAFLPYIQGEVRLGATAARIWPRRREVEFQDGSTVSYDTLINTTPLPRLIAMLGSDAPVAVRDAAAGLKHVSVRCVNLGVGRENLTEKLWIDGRKDSVFHRIFVQGNASPRCNPPGGFGLTCEITYSPATPLPVEGDALIQRCVDDCRRLGIMGSDDPVWAALSTDVPYAYPVSDHGSRDRVDVIRAWLKHRDIFLAGRFSEWEDHDSDRAFIAGRDTAFEVREAVSRKREGGAVPATLSEDHAAA